jgi:MFS family permease
MPDEKIGFLESLKRPTIRTLTFSRGFNKLAGATVSYGAMVALAAAGASQFEISLVSASGYLSAVLFGLQGGLLSDTLSKRRAILSGYLFLAALCFTVPLLFGIGVYQLMTIMFLSSAINQVISPSLKAAVALVATPAQLATVAATVSLASSIASALGSSVLAPLLIGWTSMQFLLVVCAGIYLGGAWVSTKLPRSTASKGFVEAAREINWKPVALSRKHTAKWLYENRQVAVVILTGTIVVALFEAFNTLIPVYVRDVLHANPTNAVYIFAPAGLGFLFGTLLTPWGVEKIGARKLAVAAALLMSVSMVGFALIDQVAPYFAPFNPLRIIGWLFDIEISDAVLAAGVIAIPANLGSTMSGAAVQQFVNAHVPVERQGAMFGTGEVQDNIFTLGTVLIFGAISTAVGPKSVFLIAPMIAFLLIASLIRYSYLVYGGRDISVRDTIGVMSEGDEYQTKAEREAAERNGTGPSDEAS